MTEHSRFNYKNGQELRCDAERMGLHLPWSDDLSVLASPLAVGRRRVSNRFAALPVEGRDSNFDGTPSELTFRRYRRYAAGGFGLIHFEAAAVWQGGRSSDRQLLLAEETAPRIKALLEAVREAAAAGLDQKPLCILQLQESERYRRATGTVPGLAWPDAEFDARAKVPQGTPLLTDQELDGILKHMAAAAALAYQIGFDGVDVKACHRYLLSELLAARRRPGKYGGSFENRVRMVLDAIDGIRSAVPDPEFLISSRLNIYDAIAGGWGVGEGLTPDLTEPLKLIGLMERRGVSYISATCGTPYGRAWVNRPFDRLIPGQPPAPEHPMEGVCRGLELTAAVQKAYPAIPMAGFGCSWFRQFLPNVAAGAIAEGGAQFAGLGRMIFAYPDMPRDVLSGKGADPAKSCVTCSLCSQVMARGGRAGCYVRDREVYDLLKAENR